jgi:hypothetical protein
MDQASEGREQLLAAARQGCKKALGQTLEA